MICDIESAAAGIVSAAGAGVFSFMIPGLSRIICWNDKSMGGTGFTSLLGEKNPVKSNFMLSMCCRRILVALTRTIATALCYLL